jgi:hypothetical protein
MADGVPVEGPRSITRLIDKINDGQTQIELSEELHELCKELIATARAKSAKVTGAFDIKLTLAVTARGEVSLSVAHKRTAKKPIPAPAHFWMTKGGNLTDSNPQQTRLALTEVKPPAMANDDDDTGEQTH